ncbi:acyltransferase family protein [Sphingomonas arantia]|uniref:Acyltransferase family protein n=1 Tax=Sphingomonas arantia TaxID=1460676 RepID=A0ABW4TWX9_9SPHN
MNGQTIGKRLEELRAPVGFDYLRIGLSVAVLLFHAVVTSYGRTVESALVWDTLLGSVVRMILPMFFALSGFLVAGSIFRSGTTVGFVLLRALRLLPALTVEVIISALIIGTVFTTLPLAEYLSSRATWTYFANILGRIHYQLPGVFQSNPDPTAVNMSLWTIPYELECYLALIFLMVTRLVKMRAAVVAITSLTCVAMFAGAMIQTEPVVLRAIDARALIVCFLAGVSIYLYRDRIKLSLPAFLACTVVSVALLGWNESSMLTPPLIAYLTVYLGMTNPPKNKIIASGDYSYGIYLYAYPIQQAVSYYPELRHWWINVLITLPASFLCALFSWHCVEKHVLKYKKAIAGAQAPLPRLESWALGHTARGWRAISRRHVATPEQQ